MIVQRRVRLLGLLIGVAQPVTQCRCSLVCARPHSGDYKVGWNIVHMFGFSYSLEYLAIISRFRSGCRGRPLVHWNSPFRSTWGDHREGLARVTYRRYDMSA